MKEGLIYIYFPTVDIPLVMIAALLVHFHMVVVSVFNSLLENVTWLAVFSYLKFLIVYRNTNNLIYYWVS